jgi:PPM family protein phosphatase
VTSILHQIFRKRVAKIDPVSDQVVESSSTQSQTDALSSQVSEETGSLEDSKSPHEISQIIVAIAQSVGIQRDRNEDTLFSLSTTLVTGEKSLVFGVYIIADGMGGYENGEVASRMAVELVTAHILDSLYLPLLSDSGNNFNLSVQEILHAGIATAHQEVKNKAAGSGTTLTMVLLLGEQMTVAHIGDSRAYLVDPGGEIKLLTHDHTLVKRLEEIGQITAEQAAVHPHRNVLYRALGQGEACEPDIATYPVQSGHQVLLCSDGLWGVVPEAEIVNNIQSNVRPQDACNELVRLANEAGGPDNITVILIRLPG